MAFHDGSGCPSAHPVALPRLAVIAIFNVKDARGYGLSSGGPETAHGDFWNTWRQRKLRKLVGRCLGVEAMRLCGRLGG